MQQGGASQAIRSAATRDMDRVRELFREYQRGLGVDLCFQGFEQELASLPGRYAPPRGIILLAGDADGPAGCVALRPLTAGEAELKRLYVRPAYRGLGLGKALCGQAMSFAEEAGYASIVLDTLPSMRAAQRLYAAFGFVEIPAYYPNPEAGVRYYRYRFR